MAWTKYRAIRVRPLWAHWNMQAHCRLVLLSRSRELVDAVGEEYLVSAAALELLPVARDDAADYLARCRVQPSSKAWQQLITQIRDDPGTVIADALNSPLALTLVRDTFQVDADTSLLAPDQFLQAKRSRSFSWTVSCRLRTPPGPVGPHHARPGQPVPGKDRLLVNEPPHPAIRVSTRPG